ncbi:MAG: DUF3450 family protein [Deltaproteobacteria bacterium]|nr:DUF3450 family protein [Deltaproteobacteria bacterium]
MLLVLLLTLAAQASPNVDTLQRLAAGVAAERAAVETLADDVARTRAQARDELGALQRRRTELEGRLAEVRLLQRELQARADVASRVAAADVVKGASARAPLRAAIADLRQRIAVVPFRAGTRLQGVESVERGLSAATVAASTAQLWALLLREARLLDETAGGRQPIVVDGRTVMAEVAHVGPLVWFRTQDGVVGVAEAGGWRVVGDVEGQQRIAFFLDALRRDAAAGLFLLPAVIP